MTATASGPILEEAPSIPASHILNGWISALCRASGRWPSPSRTTARAPSSRPASRRCAPTSPAYDTGWWTRYCLYPHPLEDLAKPIYHRVHADQVDALHRLTGIAEFAAAADRWRGYDRRAAAAAAIAQKALFVALDGRRRRRRPRFGPDDR